MGCLYQSHIFINMRCYVYLHRRFDTGNIFYVGRGTVNKKSSGKCNRNTYSRAYVKHKHNKYWMRITEKTLWSVEIIEDNLSWEDSIKLEIFYIQKYGRKDLNEGTLVNFTDGGEGSIGIIMSDKSIKIQRNRMSSELNPMKNPQNKFKTSDRLKKNNPMNQQENKNKVSDSLKLFYSTNIHPRKNKPREDLRQRNLTNNPTKNPEVIEKIRKSALSRDNKGSKNPAAKKVKNIESGVEYGSIKDCVIDMGISHTTIYRYLKNGKIIYI